MSFWKKDAPKTPAPQHADVGRNDPCYCGSGKKYKKCCIGKDEAAERKVLEANWEKSAAEAKEQAEKDAKENKGTKETPAAPAKHTGFKQSARQQHPAFIPGQVSTPRKSGGG
jgi:hypothetical protein